MSRPDLERTDQASDFMATQAHGEYVTQRHGSFVRSTMNIDNNPSPYPILPGEKVSTAEDGTVTLICRNGVSMRFTRQEWETYNTDFMSNLSTSDVIETMIAAVAKEQRVDHDYVIDLLLELHTRAVRDEQVRKDMVRIWTRSCNELRWFALHGVAPDEPMPYDWTPFQTCDQRFDDTSDTCHTGDTWDTWDTGDNMFPF